MLIRFSLTGALVLGAALLSSSCGKPEIAVYTAPKDVAAGSLLPNMPVTLPTGWQANPTIDGVAYSITLATGGMVSVRSFSAAEATEVIRNLSASMPTTAGGEGGKKPVEAVKVGGLAATKFTFETMPETAGGQFIFTVVEMKEKAWVFKLAGPPGVLLAQSAANDAFLTGVRWLPTMESAPAPAAASPVPAPAAPPAAPALPAAIAAPPQPSSDVPGKPPAAWTVLPAGPMQAAKFSLPGADVAVSIFPSDTGGMISNINRWRTQLGLPPETAENLASAAQPLPGAPADSALVELSHNGKSLLAAVVPRGGKFFFYKLLGDSTAVSTARAEFITFASHP